MSLVFGKMAFELVMTFIDLPSKVAHDAHVGFVVIRGGVRENPPEGDGADILRPGFEIRFSVLAFVVESRTPQHP